MYGTEKWIKLIWISDDILESRNWETQYTLLLYKAIEWTLCEKLKCVEIILSFLSKLDKKAVK